MEVVISIGIIAVIVPIVMALTVAGGSGSREATEDTRAAFLARSVIEEVILAREDRGRVIEGKLSWPDFPSSGERIAMSADREGRLIEVLESGEYEQGVTDPEAAYLVSVHGELHAPESDPEAEILSKVEVRIETPVRARSENRKARVFVRLMHPND